MIIRMYSIHDVKSEAYTQPFFQQTDGQSTRMFGDLVNDQDHPFGKHPSDYTLFFVGTFDDQKGTCEKITPISIGNGVEFLTTQPIPT